MELVIFLWIVGWLSGIGLVWTNGDMSWKFIFKAPVHIFGTILLFLGLIFLWPYTWGTAVASLIKK